MEGSFLHTNGITETPTARFACVDTKPVFLIIRQGYSAADCQSRKEVGRESEETHFPPNLRAPGFPSLTQTYAGGESQTIGSPCACAIGLPDLLSAGITGICLGIAQIWKRPAQPFKRQIVAAHSISTLLL